MKPKSNKPTQDDLHAFIKNRKNIAKAVEGSMEKRLESNRTVSKLLDRYFIMPTASILDENTKDGFAARDKQSKEVIESQLLALILDCKPEGHRIVYAHDLESRAVYSEGFRDGTGQFEQNIRDRLK